MISYGRRLAGILASNFPSRESGFEETVSRLGKQQKKWYGEGG
jgi:hypothetical protein